MERGCPLETMRCLVAALAVAAAAAQEGEDHRSLCRGECKVIHTRVSSQKPCASVTRALPADERSAASNACLGAFNRGVTDDCETSCLTKSLGAEANELSPLKAAFDRAGRPPGGNQTARCLQDAFSL